MPSQTPLNSNKFIPTEQHIEINRENS